MKKKYLNKLINPSKQFRYLIKNSSHQKQILIIQDNILIVKNYLQSKAIIKDNYV